MDAETPNQIVGVLAHETGHIAGGHLSKMRGELANAQTAAILTTLLGVGAVVATARSGSNIGGNPMAAIVGPQSAIMRSLLAYQRQQEEQADRAGVKFLTLSNQSSKGMYDTFKRMADQQLFASRYIDPYVQSHPMASERIARVAEVARANPYWDKKDPPELQQRHDLTRAKLFGYIDRPDSVLRRYPRATTAWRRVMHGGVELSPFRSAGRRCANRFADPGAAQQPLFLRAQGPGAGGLRTRSGSRRATAARDRLHPTRR